MVAAMSEKLLLLDTAQGLQTHLDLGPPAVLYTTPLQPLLTPVYPPHHVMSLVSRSSLPLVQLVRSSASRMFNNNE